MAGGARPPSDIKSRIFKFAGFLFIWALLIVARLTYLQVLQYREWVQRAERQQQRTVEISPQRGIIYDRNGQELAMTVQVDSIFAVPSEVHEENQKTTAALLAGVTGADATGVLERMQSQRNFAWVARKVDSETAARVRSLGLRGIYFQKELKRFYPKRGLAAQVLGYVGMEDTGLAGIERQYQDQLNGAKGRVEITMDARRKWFGHIEHPPEPGSNVVLTIDEKIQYIAEKELQQAMRETQAVSGTVVVQNPRTGEILALANAPSFNPNVSRDIMPEKLKNHAVSDVYEPGSVFKTVTYSSVFEENKHMQDYGFGQPTNVELPGETRGLLRKPGKWAASSIGSMAIGQEVGVTPLQVVSMMSAVANDGVYSAPRIVAGVTPPDQGYRRVEFHPQGQRRVISSYTSAIMRRLTEEVVLQGTARRAILDGYTSAGKTGTAQKIDPRTRAYSKTDYVASFVGFAPVNNAAITIAVILDSPRGLHQGGQVSAPVFNRIAAQVLAYLGVPHDVEPKNNPARRALVARAAEKDLEDAQPNASGHTMDLAGTLIPSGVAPLTAGKTPEQPLQAPAPAKIDARGGSVVLDAGGSSTVPWLLGLSMREAIESAHKAGFELQVVGSGLVREQQPPPGAYLPSGSKIAVRFAR